MRKSPYKPWPIRILIRIRWYFKWQLKALSIGRLWLGPAQRFAWTLAHLREEIGKLPAGEIHRIPEDATEELEKWDGTSDHFPEWMTKSRWD